MNSKSNLGVDVGGVIIDWIPHIGKELDLKGPRYLETPEVADAVASLKTLNEGVFKERVFLVSKYDPKYGPERVIEWLDVHNFWERTGIPKSHFYPCAERNEKAGICNNLNITHFVDDRTEVLSHMTNDVLHLIAFQSKDFNEYPEISDKVTRVESWEELMHILTI